MAKSLQSQKPPKIRTAESYKHPESESPMRPDVGTQAQFKKNKPPVTYRYDSSLSPALDWDGQNSARESGERQLAALAGELAEIGALVAPGLSPAPAGLKAGATKDEKPSGSMGTIQAHLSKAEEAIQNLKALSKPFLNWAGKAERLSFDVPTLPLFVHERLSTKAIIETLTSHKRDKQTDMFSLFGDPQHSFTDQILRAYERPCYSRPSPWRWSSDLKTARLARGWCRRPPRKPGSRITVTCTSSALRFNPMPGS